MIREVLTKLDLGIIPNISLMMFVLFYLAMVVWVFRRGAGDYYFKMSRLPLEIGKNKEVSRGR